MSYQRCVVSALPFGARAAFGVSGADGGLGYHVVGLLPQLVVGDVSRGDLRLRSLDDCPSLRRARVRVDLGGRDGVYSNVLDTIRFQGGCLGLSLGFTHYAPRSIHQRGV